MISASLSKYSHLDNCIAIGILQLDICSFKSVQSLESEVQWKYWKKLLIFIPHPHELWLQGLVVNKYLTGIVHIIYCCFTRSKKSHQHPVQRSDDGGGSLETVENKSPTSGHCLTGSLASISPVHHPIITIITHHHHMSHYHREILIKKIVVN